MLSLVCHPVVKDSTALMGCSSSVEAQSAVSKALDERGQIDAVGRAKEKAKDAATAEGKIESNGEHKSGSSKPIEAEGKTKSRAGSRAGSRR